MPPAKNCCQPAGNQTRAAQLLEISRAALRKELALYNLVRTRFHIITARPAGRVCV